jgi:hypothetical protein
MKDTVHPPVHPSVHQRPRASVQTRRSCASNGTQFGRVQNTELGWNDPGLDALPRPKGLRGRSSPVFCPWLSLRMYRHTAGGRVPRVKTVKNAFCTLGTATSSPSVQISTTLSTNSWDRTPGVARASAQRSHGLRQAVRKSSVEQTVCGAALHLVRQDCMTKGDEYLATLKGTT